MNQTWLSVVSLRKIFRLLSFLFFFGAGFFCEIAGQIELFHSAWAKRQVIERIVVVVNDEIILLSEWNKRVRFLKPQLDKIIDPVEKKKQEGILRKRVLGEIVNEKVLEQKARELQIQIEESQIDRAIEDTRKHHNLSKENFQAALLQQGFTISGYREMVRKQLRKLRLIQQELRGKIQVSKEDVKAFYHQVSRSVHSGPSEYRIRHIVFLLGKDANAEKISQAKTSAKNVLKLVLKEPSTFVSLAKKFSEGPAKEQGGDLGYLKIGEVHPAIERVMKTLSSGQVHNKLIQTPMGYHILYLEEKRSSGVLSFQEAKDNIRKQLQKKAYAEGLERYINRLKEKATIEYR